ncbi:MAG: hypothetical protein QM817_34995 [Archangium sp.]
MSSRTSNLSLNRVDWAMREQLLTLAPSALHAYLLTLPLQQASEDDQRSEARVRDLLTHLDNPLERFLLERHGLLTGLRVDRPRYASRALELLEGDASIRDTLSQLAFPSGNTRMGGEVWLTDPLVVLASVDPRTARDLLTAAEQMRDCREPFTPLEGAPGLVELLGGLDGEGEPRDRVFEPAHVAKLVDLRNTRAPLPRFLPIALEALDLWRPDEHEVDLETFITQELAFVVRLYAHARSEGHGVDVHWHPNP